MRITNFVSAAVLLASVTDAQKLAEWVEATSGVTYKIGISDAAAAPFDIFLSIVAPASVGWVGIATGGCMLRSPILVAWPNSGSVVVSSRWATAYHPPIAYNGTSTTVYSSSSANSTHWVANLLCVGCSKWDGGSIDPQGTNATFGWGVSSHAVESPSNPSSPIRFHDIGKSHFELDLKPARFAKGDFDALLKSMG